MKRLMAIGFTLVAVLVLTGCETMQGVGRDLEKAGQAIEDAAK
jgi:predicted small secreted protein